MSSENIGFWSSLRKEKKATDETNTTSFPPSESSISLCGFCTYRWLLRLILYSHCFCKCHSLHAQKREGSAYKSEHAERRAMVVSGEVLLLFSFVWGQNPLSEVDKPYPAFRVCNWQLEIKSISLLTLTCSSLGSVLNFLSIFLLPVLNCPRTMLRCPCIPRLAMLPLHWMKGMPGELARHCKPPPLCYGVLHSRPLVTSTCLCNYFTVWPSTFLLNVIFYITVLPQSLGQMLPSERFL